MEFIHTIIDNRKLIVQLGKNEFKNKFANTNLGAIWGLITPFVFLITYVIVFQYILKTNSAGDYPYIVWFLPGIAMWLFLNDSILAASSSIRGYSYLVKKVVFPVDTIPVISIISSSIVGIFLIIISIIVCSCFGYFPNIFKLLYIMLAAICLIVSLTRLTSAICTLIPDFGQLLGVVMQLFFWFTPIIWNIAMLKEQEELYSLISCMPFTYLVNGLRAVFTGEHIFVETQIVPTCIFWGTVLIFFVWGNKIFATAKKDFADVL